VSRDQLFTTVYSQLTIWH